jgi:hypothetical protein
MQNCVDREDSFPRVVADQTATIAMSRSFPPCRLDVALYAGNKSHLTSSTCLLPNIYHQLVVLDLTLP